MTTKEFFLAGWAVVTLTIPDDFKKKQESEGGECPDSYTFRIRFLSALGKSIRDETQISLLVGPDNTKDYAFIGMVDLKTGQIRLNPSATFNDGSLCVRLARAMLRAVWRDEEKPMIEAGFSILRASVCGLCGRRLTVAKSIEDGFGPKCFAKFTLKISTPTTATG